MFNAAAKSDDLGLTPWSEKQGITVYLNIIIKIRIKNLI